MDTLLKPVVLLFDRFRFRTKFSIIMVVFLIPMLVYGYLLSSELRRTIALAELERQGVEYIKPLRQLVEHVAQHRGMTNVFLNGDASFASKINAKARQVNEDFTALKEVDDRFGEVFATARQVVGLLDKWQRLASGARSMPASESFSSHSALIAELIDYTTVIANVARMSSDPQPDTNALVEVLVESIPIVVESMGQTRGGGAGVAAAEAITPEKRLRLSVLTDRFAVAAKNMKSGFEYIFKVNPALRQRVGREVVAAISATENFQSATEREILNANAISITAGNYFSMGSKAISANLALYDKVLPLLDEMLQERGDEAQSKEIADAVLFIVVTLLLFYLFAGLYRALQRGVDDLQRVTTYFSEGDLTHRLQPKSRDEMAQIAHGLNHAAEDVGQSVLAIINSGDYLRRLGDQLIEASEQTQSGVCNQVGEINQAATAINEMSATVHEMAASTERTAGAADGARRAAEVGQQVVSETISAINSLAGDVAQSAEVIRRLEESSNSISLVLGGIRGIADQTNLLALNAAIEAARAGEQGRGFAVVADEVRTLAGRTQDATVEIQEMLERLQQGTAEAVSVMERSGESAQQSVSKAASAGDALQEITATVATIHEMTTQVATAVEEQSTVAEEINRNITNVNTLAEQTTVDADTSTEASNRVAALASEVWALLDRFKIDSASLQAALSNRSGLMEWDESLSVGIDEIDRQHKQLVSMLNELNQILAIGGGLQSVQRVLNGLANYTVTHFNYEERLLQKHNYPDFDQHKRKHEALLGKVVAFKERIDAGDVSVTDELLTFLKEWLIGHIKGTDKEYGLFLNEKGVG